MRGPIDPTIEGGRLYRDIEGQCGGAECDEEALKGDREALNSNGETLKGDEKAVKGDRGTLKLSVTGKPSVST